MTKNPDVSTKKKISARKVIGIILFATLLLSVLFSFVRFLVAPESISDGAPYEKVKSDYLLMTLQCLLGILVMLLPSLITHKFRLPMPSAMIILYYVFLYCAIFLGEIFSFYYLIPHWDVYLHATSGVMLSSLGFILVDWLNKDKSVKLSMSPLFVSLFAFCFSLAMGAMWEIYEFSFDSILGLNMQKFRTESGIDLVGQGALSDTMEDIIIDAAAGAAVAIIGFFTATKQKRKSAIENHET